MKKAIIFIILGFLLNSGLRTLFDYSFWSNDPKCYEVKDFKESINCTYKHMGLIYYTRYILVRPGYGISGWEISYP